MANALGFDFPPAFRQPESVPPTSRARRQSEPTGGALPIARAPRTLLAALRPRDEARLAAARQSADDRPIHYPFGSGQAEELAVFAGQKPIFRQLLPVGELAAARRRFEAGGLVVGDCHTGTIACPPGHRVVFVGRDAARVTAAVELESRTRLDVELGALLGYPACCTERFARATEPRDNERLIAAAVARTRGRFAPRLNQLDLGVFHYISWSPCSYDCAPSLAYADAVVQTLRAWSGAFVAGHAPAQRCPPGCQHERFVDRIDEALSAHRLLALESVQVSIAGRWDGTHLEVQRAWPTSRDRHPGVPVDGDAREAMARLAAVVEEAGRITVEGGVLYGDGVALLRTPDLVLAPFGERA
jgi:hypothetical protein